MKLSAIVASILGLGLLVSCASKPKYNDAMLEKYPGCYHDNFKIYEKCIQKNEAGEKVTAVELENTAYPGQYN
ncbi:MAG: hypothetical protein AAF202_06610 [Pseudomonadota bacterium]